jgi:hypothetical protein
MAVLLHVKCDTNLFGAFIIWFYATKCSWSIFLRNSSGSSGTLIIFLSVYCNIYKYCIIWCLPNFSVKLTNFLLASTIVGRNYEYDSWMNNRPTACICLLRYQIGCHSIEFNRFRNHLTLEIAIIWQNKTKRGEILWRMTLFLRVNMFMSYQLY